MRLTRKTVDADTPAISARDLNLKRLSSSAATLSFSQSSMKNLNMVTSGSSYSPSFSDYLNKTTVSSDKYFTTAGYIEVFLGGGTLGEISDDVLAPTTGNGWKWGSDTQEAKINMLAAYDFTGEENTVFRFKPVKSSGTVITSSDQDWTEIRLFKKERDTLGFAVRSILKNTYASWNTAEYAWRWDGRSGLGTDMGTSSSATKSDMATRYVEII